MSRVGPSTIRAGAYAWYTLAVLTFAYVLAFVDRQVLALVVGPLKTDLHLSDTQISLAQGLAFSIFYTTMGLPIGRLADRRSRVRIILVGVVLWSLATAACGFAANFGQLFAARILVGVGEATLQPAAYALISDRFPRERAAFATNVFALGGFFGAGLALLLGAGALHMANQLGALSVAGLQLTGWRQMFVLVGAFGIFAVAAVATLREPPRRDVLLDIGDGAGRSEARLLPFLRLHARTLSHHFLGYAGFLLCAYSLLAWMVTLVIREHGWTAAKAGFILGLVMFVATPVGAFSGAFLAERWRRRGQEDACFLLGAWACVLLAPAMGALWLGLSVTGTVLALGVCLGVVAMPLGVAANALQLIAPPRLKVQVGACYLLVTNLVGLGFGPTLTALLTDRVFRNEAMLNRSLALTGLLVLPISAIILWTGRAAFTRSLARCRGEVLAQSQ